MAALEIIKFKTIQEKTPMTMNSTTMMTKSKINLKIPKIRNSSANKETTKIRYNLKKKRK